MASDFFLEYNKTIRNLTETFNVLYYIGRKDLLFTIAEAIFQTAQTMIDEYCVKEEE